MAQPTYYDLAGNVVEFYHPANALEALELVVITTKKNGVDEATNKEEAPVVEELRKWQVQRGENPDNLQLDWMTRLGINPTTRSSSQRRQCDYWH